MTVAAARWKPLNDEVFFAADAVVTVDGRAIETLKSRAAHNARKRVRLCAHRDAQDPVHEMFIVHEQAAYVRPHRHGQPESFLVIEGRADVVLFDDAGAVTDVIRMGDYASGATFYYRLAQPVYHTLVIRSERLVFHETKQGPFVASQHDFAPWAPDGDDAAQARAYMERLAHLIRARPT